MICEVCYIDLDNYPYEEIEIRGETKGVCHDCLKSLTKSLNKSLNKSRLVK